MIIYHAGNFSGRLHLEQALQECPELPDMSSECLRRRYAGRADTPEGHVRARLITFADMERPGMPDALEFWLSCSKVFVDCGAYSVHMRGAEVTLRDYTAFLRHRDLADRAEAYVQLDVVGDPVATEANLHAMERDGLRPLPVYTAAAPLSYLDRLCGDYGYIALGGLRGREAGTLSWRQSTLDAVFSIAARHWPVRFHAFGITAQTILEDYPLYSADSSNAIVGGQSGIVTRFLEGDITFPYWREHLAEKWDGLCADQIGAPLSAYMGRAVTSARAMVQLEAHVTRLWQRRGVAWDGAGRYGGTVARAS